MSPHNMITCFPPPCFKGRKEPKRGSEVKRWGKTKKNKSKKGSISRGMRGRKEKKKIKKKRREFLSEEETMGSGGGKRNKDADKFQGRNQKPLGFSL